MSLYFVRHGTTAFDTKGPPRIQGWLEGGLEANGVKEVETAAKKLKNVHVSLVVASDLTRTEQTGQILAEKLGAQLTLDPRLRAWNVGQLAGTLEKVAKPFVKVFIQSPEFPIPHGEPFAHRVEQLRSFLQDLMSMTEQNPGFNVVAVTHSTNILAIEDLLAGRTPSYRANIKAPSPAEVLEVVQVRDGKYRLMEI